MIYLSGLIRKGKTKLPNFCFFFFLFFLIIFEGLNGMCVGEKRRLRIPPHLGYGASGAGAKIPPNAWLVFEVECLKIE
jgi:hypothetical protein